MPVDKNGLELKEGDIVILPCRVTGLTGDGYRENDLAIETIHPAPNGSAAVFEVNSRVVVKGMQIPELKMTEPTKLPDSHHPLDIHKGVTTITAGKGGKVTEKTDTSNLERFEKEVSPNQGRSQETLTQAQDNSRQHVIQPGDIVKYRQFTGRTGEMRVVELQINPTDLVAHYVVTDNPPVVGAPNYVVGSEDVEKVIKVIQAADTPTDPAMAPAKTFTVTETANTPTPEPAVKPSIPGELLPPVDPTTPPVPVTEQPGGKGEDHDKPTHPKDKTHGPRGKGH